MEANRTNHSAPPQLVVRVGVTGHRPSRLTHANEKVLSNAVAKILDMVRAAAEELILEPGERVKPEAPVLRIVSPLAEGADRIVAEVGLAKGFQLECPLPFRRDDYGKDFEKPASRRKFRALLSRATAVMELDGSRETPEQANEAYESVGRVVFKESDLLIAIWDGKKPTRRGGTGQIVEEALRHGTLTVWISAQGPHMVRFLTDWSHLKIDGPPLDQLGAQLKSLLRAKSETHADIRI